MIFPFSAISKSIKLKICDYTRVASQYQFPESNQSVLLNSFGINGLLTVVGERALSSCLFALKIYFITIRFPRSHFYLAHLVELSSSILPNW